MLFLLGGKIRGGEVVEGMESLKRKARTCVTCVFYEVNLGIVVDQEDGFFRKSLF